MEKAGKISFFTVLSTCHPPLLLRQPSSCLLVVEEWPYSVNADEGIRLVAADDNPLKRVGDALLIVANLRHLPVDGQSHVTVLVATHRHYVVPHRL